MPGLASTSTVSFCPASGTTATSGFSDESAENLVCRPPLQFHTTSRTAVTPYGMSDAGSTNPTWV